MSEGGSDSDCVPPTPATFSDDNDDDSVSALFDAINDIALTDRADGNGRTDADNSSTATTFSSSPSRQQRRKAKRRNKKGNQSKSQHSLEHLRRRVSHLMSCFEEHGWFVPLPRDPSDRAGGHDDAEDGRRGKVWSNRNYGADKKRQRKQTERRMLEARISQLETVLEAEHGVVDLSV